MPRTVIKFEKERQDILKKILDILEINDNNNMFSLKKLDENQEKQQKIIDLIDDIKKYFLCSKWAYFSNTKKDFKRLYLSIIKSVMKYMNVKMMSSFLHIKDGDKIKCQTFYVFEFENN